MLLLSYPNTLVANAQPSPSLSLSLKKCLKGDGQIDIDSDEAALQGAIAFASRKKARTSLGVKKGGNAGASSSGLLPDSSFIGVKLSANGRPERVFLQKD